MVAGTLLFSGTCYYAAFTNDQRYNRLAPVCNLKSYQKIMTLIMSHFRLAVLF